MLNLLVLAAAVVVLPRLQVGERIVLYGDAVLQVLLALNAQWISLLPVGVGGIVGHGSVLEPVDKEKN